MNQAIIKLKNDTGDTLPARKGSSEVLAVISMIAEAARDPSVNMDKLERLLEMKERMLTREAQIAYDTAFADMQPKLPVIDERGKHGGTSSTYAKYDDMMEAVLPILGAHGFSIRFKVRNEANRVIVTGRLNHRGGHSEESTLDLPIDATGQKNAVQAIGSSQSYGQRYVAKALLSLSSRKSDDDNGQAAGGASTITDEQVQDLGNLITATKSDILKFLKFFKIEGLSELPAKRLQEATNLLNQKRPRDA